MERATEEQMRCAAQSKSRLHKAHDASLYIPRECHVRANPRAFPSDFKGGLVLTAG